MRGESEMNLREAAQQALEALEYLDGYNGWVEVGKEIADLRAALAETTSQESRQVEPVAWMKSDGAITTDAYRASCWRDVHSVTPLYTAPPKREPLTEKQIESAVCAAYVEKALTRYDIAIARAIERAHGIGGVE